MIPHNRPTLGIEEEKAALRVIRSGWVAQGPEVEWFENEFCQFVGLPEGRAVAVANGTSALFLGLWSLQALNKRIAIPVYACSALRHAVSMIGGIEVLIDVEPGTPNIDLTSLNNCQSDITIIPHMFGLPVDISNVKGLDIIEDCAQSLGATVDGIQVGLHGRIGIYSFYATKLMTTGGQGGMVVSTDKALVDAIRDYREFDCRKDNNKRFNFKLTDLQAAIGREQLRKLPGFLKQRAKIFDKYRQSGLNILDISSKDDKHLSPVRYRAVLVTKDFGDVIGSLASVGVNAIVPVEDWELLGDPTHFPAGFKLTRETVSLPIYPTLTNSEIDIILEGISKI